MTKSFSFEVIHKSKRSHARVGKIHTPHGTIDTPSFVAVGTNGTLKSLDNAIVDQLGLDLMFCNTYHMMIQPGSKLVEKAGGLHKFINRKKPIITDSGGFQVFSLAYGSVASELKSQGTKKSTNSVLKISEDGVLFRSYRDGHKLLLTPESSVQAQKELGADIIIPFDELPPYHVDPKALELSLDRTHRWEARSLDYHLQNPNNQAMYAVIHGGINKTLRQKSLDTLKKLPFDGYSIGGSIGKTKQEMYELLEFLMPQMPEDKPNHLLGIGDLESLKNCIPFGVDTFDSSYPTKAARHGVAFTLDGPLKITKSANKHNFNPIESSCQCPTCQNHTLAYLHHLFKSSELTALALCSYHNLFFMVRLMETYRNQILNDEI